jgi:aspartyl-tRNA(Asn)/glutamyl-tRNA(Gln) amidotransferase subunit A
MHHLTIATLSQKLRTREISSVELVKHFLNRIQTFNPALNAFITITSDDALAEAKKADQQIANKEASVFTGIPIAHKDIFCTEGVKTTCASKMLHNFIPPYDATLVARLKAAGFIMLGKLNMDEFAMGSSNEYSHFGPVKNPWDVTCVPGGSSGGSAAAVAARLTPAATGTDTGGSIRQPAALCGITGLKPTYGRVSRFGMIAFASSFDQGGVLAKTAEDIALLLEIIAGFDDKDSTSVDMPVPNFTKHLNNSLRGLRVGLPQEYLRQTLDPHIAKLMLEAAHQLEKEGAILQDISLPHSHLAIPAYYAIAPAECCSNLARYDGIRYGYRCEMAADLNDLYERTRAEGFGEEVKHRIMIGTHVLSSGYYDAYYFKAQKVRRLICNDFTDAFKTVDIILNPTTPSPAFKLGSKTSDRVNMYLSDIFTVPVNLAGLPSLSTPIGFKDGLPLGLQLTGNYFDEARILNVAHRLQQITDWHSKMPRQYE